MFVEGSFWDALIDSFARPCCQIAHLAAFVHPFVFPVANTGTTREHGKQKASLMHCHQSCAFNIYARCSVSQLSLETTLASRLFACARRTREVAYMHKVYRKTSTAPLHPNPNPTPTPSTWLILRNWKALGAGHSLSFHPHWSQMKELFWACWVRSSVAGCFDAAERYRPLYEWAGAARIKGPRGTEMKRKKHATHSCFPSLEPDFKDAQMHNWEYIIFICLLICKKSHGGCLAWPLSHH